MRTRLTSSPAATIARRKARFTSSAGSFPARVKVGIPLFFGQELGQERCQQWCQVVPKMVPYGSHSRRIGLHQIAPKPAKSRLDRRRQPDAVSPQLVGIYAPFRTTLHRLVSPCTSEKSKYARRDSNPQPSVPKTEDEIPQPPNLTRSYDATKDPRCQQWCQHHRKPILVPIHPPIFPPICRRPYWPGTSFRRRFGRRFWRWCGR